VSGGTVFLVGAGPGDPGLMTRRSLELIGEADAILYDRLIPPRALDGARPDAERRYVGKEPGAAALAQEEINALLVELARQGKRVVRLKGGDPFVFGRGGEEAEALAAAGIPFEVVPGVTAGVAAPAYAGIPVTHRDAASAVAFVTGHEDPEKPESALDWEALARFPGTLVLYMGVKNLSLIAARLIAAGRDPQEPAAVVERGTYPGQRTVVDTLTALPERVNAEGIRPPSITLIGPVAALHDTLGWLERRPLNGAVVAVTRARAQASGLAARLGGLGAEVIEAPAIRIEPRPLEGELLAAVSRIREYALVCVTSPNGGRLLFEALAEIGQDARALAGATVAAIGPGTAAELERHGIRADVVPERFVAEGLVEELAGVPVEGRSVLIARAAEARSLIPDALRERGAEVDDVALYDTRAERLDDGSRERLARATHVTFTSSSTVRFFLDAGGELPAGARLVSIGPVTSATARELGLHVDVEASRHDIDGLVDALVADARESPA
jgi:uroporphyrinogen III methyltransferase / synthase